MAYTNVWDDSTPLDTQSANQGAADFRQLKLDVMERVRSFGAGLLANRPTPETTSAVVDWTGVTYLATDTNQLFRWSGTVWVDITSSTPGEGVIFSNAQLITAPIDTTEDTVYTGTLLANSLGVNGAVDVRFFCQLTATAPINFKLTLGGVTIYNNAFGAGMGTVVFEYSIQNQSVAVQSTLLKLFQLGGVGMFTAPTAIDTTVNQTLAVTVQKTVAADSVALYNGFAKIA